MTPATTALPLVDLVILADTSPSSKDDAIAISAAAATAIASARQQCPADLRVVWLGLEGTWRKTVFDRTLRQYLTQQCGVTPEQLRSRQRGELKDAGAQEDAARAIEDVSNYFDWREQAHRSLLYLGDEALDAGGDRIEVADIEAANLAIQRAQAAGVRIYTYFGRSQSKHREAIAQEYRRIATATHGQGFLADSETPTDFNQVLMQVICTSQTPIPTPEILTMSKKATPNKNNDTPAANTAAAQPPSPPVLPKSYVPTTMTGLQDYSYWWEYAREHAKTGKASTQPFRRGRIWA